MKWNLGMRFHDGAFVNESLYFSHRLMNGLFRYDLKSKETYYITQFPDEDLLVRGNHRRCVNAGDNLIFVPELGRHIHVYNMITKQIQGISLENYRKPTHICTSDVFLWEQKLFIFPVYADDSLLILDTNTWDLQEEKRFSEILSEEAVKEDAFALVRLAQKGNDIWAAVYKKDIVIKFSLENRTVEKYMTGVPNLFGIYAGADGFWLHGISGREIYLWNPSDGSLKNYCSTYPCTNHAQRYYNYIFDSGKFVYALSATDECVYKLEDDTFIQINFSENVQFDKFEMFKFFRGSIYDGALWIYPFSSDALLRIKLGESQAEVIILPKLRETMQKTKYDMICKDRAQHICENAINGFLYEIYSLQLEDYIESILTVNK